MLTRFVIRNILASFPPQPYCDRRVGQARPERVGGHGNAVAILITITIIPRNCFISAGVCVLFVKDTASYPRAELTASQTLNVYRLFAIPSRVYIYI